MATEQTSLLDDAARMQAVDRRNMLRVINDIPEQFETGMAVAQNHSVEPSEEKPNVVLIVGTGYGAVAAHMIASAFANEVDVPLYSSNAPPLPGFVGEQSVVFIVDYSGKTDLMLDVYREARQRHARVICLTGGGKLMETAVSDGIPAIRVPPGQPERTAIGYLMAPLVVYLEKLGLASGVVQQLSFAVKHIKNHRELFRFEYPAAKNLPKQIAQALYGKIPVIYGHAGPEFRIVNEWRRLLNANSKIPGICGVFPEAAFNDLSGWELADRLCKDFAFVFLRSANAGSGVVTLMSAAKEVLGKFPVIEVEIKGATVIERLCYGLYLGSYVSYYLALLNEVDPTRMEYVSLLEARLAGEPLPEVETQSTEDARTPED